MSSIGISEKFDAREGFLESQNKTKSETKRKIGYNGNNQICLIDNIKLKAEAPGKLHKHAKQHRPALKYFSGSSAVIHCGGVCFE